jgi:hypothetical protein
MAKESYVALGVSRARTPPSIRQFQDIVEAYQALSDPRTPTVSPVSISLFRDFDVGRPSLEEVFDRFVESFTGRLAPKAGHVRPVELTFLVSPWQAARGGVVAVAVPVIYPCPDCRGSGRNFLYLCTSCGGRRVVAAEEPVHFRLPPRLRDGDVVEVPLEALGIHDQHLQIQFRVG